MNLNQTTPLQTPDTPRTILEDVKQKLRTGAVSDKDTAKSIEKILSSEDLFALGVFIAKELPPGSYPIIFHKCFVYLGSREQRAAGHRFTIDFPEHAAMVAPFENFIFRQAPLVNDKILTEEMRGDKKSANVKPQISILEAFYSHFDGAKSLFDTCINSETWITCSVARKLTEYYLEKAPYFLIPYTERLVRAGILQEEDLNTIRSWSDHKSKKSWDFFRVAEFHYSPAQRETVRQLQKMIGDQHAAKGSTGDENSLNRALDRERSKSVNRFLTHIAPVLRNGERPYQSVNSRLDCLKECRRLGAGVFRIFQDLNLGSGAATRFISRIKSSDPDALLVDYEDFSDIAAVVLTDGRKAFIKALTTSMADDGRYAYESAHVVEHAYEYAAILTPEEMRKVCGAVTRYAKVVWATNLPALLDFTQLNVTDFCELPRHYSSMGLTPFAQLRQQVNNLGVIANERGFTEKGITETVLKVISEFPQSLIEDRAIEEFYTLEERHALLMQHVTLANAADVIGCFREPFMAADAIGQKLIALIEIDPSIAKKVFEEHGFYGLVQLMGEERTLALLADQFDFRVHEALSESGDCLPDLFKYPESFKTVVAKVLGSSHLKMIGNFIKSAVNVFKNHERAKTEVTLYKFLQEETRTAVAKYPQIAAEEGVLRLLPDEAPVILKNVPEEFLVRSYDRFLMVAQFLDPEHRKYLVERHSASLAYNCDPINFQAGKRSKLTAAILSKVRELSIIVGAEVKFEDRVIDASKKILARISRSSYFDPDFSLSYMGGKVEVEQINSLPLDLLREVHRIQILDTSAFAVRHRNKVDGCSKEHQRKLAEHLEVAVAFGIDAEIADKVDWSKEVSVETICEKISIFLHRELNKALDAGEHERFFLIGQSVACQRAFLTYFENTCRFSELETLARRIFHFRSHEEFVAWRDWDLSKVETREDRESALEILKHKGIVPKLINLDSYEKWLEPLEMKFSIREKEKIEYSQELVRKVLRASAEQEHIDSALLEAGEEELRTRIDLITKPLAELEAERQKFVDARDPDHSPRYRAVLEEIRLAANSVKEELQRARILLLLKVLQRTSVEEFEENENSFGGTQFSISRAIQLLSNGYDDDSTYFNNDLLQIASHLRDVRNKGGSVSDQGRTREILLSDKLDFELLLRNGELPVATCQHFEDRKAYDGYNKGLLADLTDSPVRILWVFDESKNVIGRAKLRLAESADCGAIHMEPIYPSNADSEAIDKICAFVKEKARRCKLQSYALDGLGEDRVGAAETILYVRAGRAPKIYSDSDAGLSDRGELKIEHARPLVCRD